jgi:glycosyltransferase 2 family protein
VSRFPWKRAAGALLVLAAAGYLAYTIADNWQQMRAFEWRVRPLWLAASVAAHVAVLAAGVWGWGLTLRNFEHARVPLSTLLRLWFVSNLARYVPGKVFQFLALAQLSRAAGLSAGVLLTSILVHTGMALLSATVLAAWTLGDVVVPALGARWAGPVVTGLAILAVHPAFLNLLIGAVPRLLKRPLLRWSGSWRTGTLLLTLSTLNWAAYGVAYHLFIGSLAEVPWRLLPELAGVNALSFVIGYASLLPGGIGLREVAMTELLRPFLPGGVGAVLAVASRLWTIATELVGAGVAIVLARGAVTGVAEEGRNGG